MAKKPAWIKGKKGEAKKPETEKPKADSAKPGQKRAALMYDHKEASRG